MSLYTVYTTVPVLVEIHVDEDDDGNPTGAVVRRVIVADDDIPATLAAVTERGGHVEDENGLTVRPYYFGSRADHPAMRAGQPSPGLVDEPDWPAIDKAYLADEDTWPSWEFGR